VYVIVSVCVWFVFVVLEKKEEARMSNFLTNKKTLIYKKRKPACRRAPLQRRGVDFFVLPSTRSRK